MCKCDCEKNAVCGNCMLTDTGVTAAVSRAKVACAADSVLSSNKPEFELEHRWMGGCVCEKVMFTYT